MPDKFGRNNSRYVRNNRRLKQTVEPVCALCGKPIDRSLHYLDGMAWTSDHVTPLSQGGSLYGPRVPMHRSCNAKKGDGTRGAGSKPSLATTEDW